MNNKITNEIRFSRFDDMQKKILKINVYLSLILKIFTYEKYKKNLKKIFKGITDEEIKLSTINTLNYLYHTSSDEDLKKEIIEFAENIKINGDIFDYNFIRKFLEQEYIIKRNTIIYDIPLYPTYYDYIETYDKKCNDFIKMIDDINIEEHLNNKEENNIMLSLINNNMPPNQFICISKKQLDSLCSNFNMQITDNNIVYVYLRLSIGNYYIYIYDIYLMLISAEKRFFLKPISRIDNIPVVEVHSVYYTQLLRLPKMRKSYKKLLKSSRSSRSSSKSSSS